MKPGAMRALRTLGIVAVSAAGIGGMGVYCVNAGAEISRLYTELRQQHRLKAIQSRNISAMAVNSELAAGLNRPRVLALEEITAAVVNLSAQLKNHGLAETYFKLEQREVLREGASVTVLNRLVIEGTGAYEDALGYIAELADGGVHYFIEKAGIRAGSADGVVLRVECVVIGFSDSPAAVVPAPPEEYMLENPFKKEVANE